tara:strand:- start:243 stop:1343 length:1101 start_codon:yes stop_codon:yes gene_type:complete
MGLFSRKQIIEAQEAPQIMGDNQFNLVHHILPAVNRRESLNVPSIVRCRNLLAGTIGSIPLQYYKKSTGEEIAPPRWIEQLSPSQPQFVTLSYLVDSLYFYGTAYLEVVEEYAEDLRPARFEWVANTRVTYDLNLSNTFVTQYYVDASPRPMSGVGSLVTFQSFLEGGVLQAGARTIKAAIDVQRAAVVAASTPMATGFLKNTGADLPPKEVSGLINAWKRARENSGTAYLTSTIDYQTIGFSPKDMLYNEAIQNLSTEIARLSNIDPYYLSSAQNNSMTYSNIIDERKQFVALSLQPYISCLEQRLSMNDISTAGHAVKFNLNDTFLRTDPMERLLVIEKMLTLGLITTEQAMQMEDLSPNGSGN